jgi:hypothetical protein
MASPSLIANSLSIRLDGLSCLVDRYKVDFMHRTIYALRFAALTMLLGACANSESTAEQAAAASCE